ncbi:unnamed protein product [Staurois parvus]|uniref:Myb/SANT-like DNA-binding domain-containing protein n=1 Tax=Staurois parvus TaxID=386267 RepID=A0ABN9G202_9NEOB|nr:unnamed protein product [Staurois parvus]
MDPEDRVWTTAETHTLLDLIQDGGFIPGLVVRDYSIWAVFERLSVLLNRCNIKVSKEQVKAHWRRLKGNFWKRKRMVDDGQAPALTGDFPFYEEMEQLLTSQKPAKVRKREADSSGLEAPSMLDSEGLVLSTSSREEAVEEVQNGARPNVSGEVPGRGLHSPPNLQWCVHTLNTTIQNLQDFSQRLQDSVQDVLRLMEQVNHMSSF